MDSYIPGSGAGFFDFDKDMTSSNGGTGSTTDGNAMAAFLLGYPSTVRTSQISVSTPLNLYTRYYGGYAQDDWRISQKLTLNYGLRLEHEDGLREEENRFTVGFDPTMTSALSAMAVPADSLAGNAARTVAGGLMYAGVDGNPTSQGNAARRQVVAAGRRGLRLRRQDRAARRLRSVLGAVQLRRAEHRHQQLRAGRLHPEHDPHPVPDVAGHADQPVPEWRCLAHRQHARRA